ncbi:MAG: CDP-diacylglycerol--glycerol-3-phosphate 3-phosphatidyltransferase [Oscillospiraceae bacterium]|nr:CDP-diacylglycerol--glycerol-3-phosphate 3-phosphatidyltransferase [Oscillospiraceae bacterium]
MNLPNKLTLLRIGLVPVFAVFAALAVPTHGRLWYLLAGIVFGAASLTDLFDGKIARKYGLVTNFGKFADPLADKMLTTAAFLYMQREGVCDPAVLIVILAREFAVSGLRMLAAGSEEKIVIPANIWGKLKTAGMMVTICAFYFGCALWPESAFLRSAANILCWLCAAVTLFSGITYFTASKSLFSDMYGGKNTH